MSDIVTNIREWKTEGIDLVIAETIDHDTITINPKNYEVIQGVYYNGERIYREVSSRVGSK